ncbi:MAG: hypothetical protein JKX76_03005 [Colwellia sp.]|nr:hypothetical protein [Colwellia sp.]
MQAEVQGFAHKVWTKEGSAKDFSEYHFRFYSANHSHSSVMNNPHLIISGLSMVGSLSGYYYAKRKGQEYIPALLIGGFIGAVIGEALVKRSEKST